MLPFAFYNETIGTAIGATFAGRGLPQPQAGFWATAVAADSGTRFLLLGAEDLRVSRFERLFYDLRLAGGSYREIDVYVDGNPQFEGEVAGSNDSDPQNFVRGEGDDNGFDLALKYLLPIGDAADRAEIDVVLRDGLVSAGGRDPSTWNPLSDGLTTTSMTLAYRSQDIDGEFGSGEQTTANVKLALDHDNSDFSVNPSRGSRQLFRVSHDWGGWDSTDSWTALELDLSKYLSLGSTEKTRQRVLALNFWIIDTPSWEGGDGIAISGRPPAYAGASLGGLQRLRGYPEGRFNSRSAVYYGAEFRLIPRWNRIADWSLLERFSVDLDWIQFVGFAEAGRVAGEFDLSVLHEDMKWSGGFGLRAFANHLIVRAEVAASDEDTKFVMSINQPF